jgi:hypothetical protein
MQEMNESQKNLWVSLRADLIVHFHQKNNRGMFIGGFSKKQALQTAREQLVYDLHRNHLRITLEEMLLNTPDECLLLLGNRMKEKSMKLSNFKEN